MPRFHAVLLASVLALMAVAGCASKSEQSATTETATESASEPAATSTDAAVTPPMGATAGWQSVQRREAELKAIIEGGQLDKVHDQAEAIQAALEDAAGGATNLPSGQRAQIEARIAEADKLAAAVHDAAHTGDLTKTRAEFDRLQLELRTIEGLLGAGAK